MVFGIFDKRIKYLCPLSVRDFVWLHFLNCVVQIIIQIVYSGWLVRQDNINLSMAKHTLTKEKAKDLERHVQVDLNEFVHSYERLQST